MRYSSSPIRAATCRARFAGRSNGGISRTVADSPNNNNMNVEIQSVSPTRSVLSITASPDEAKAARASVVRDYAARATISGFRPGKAPASIVERKFADRIAADAEARVEGQSYDKAVKENSLDVLEVISVDDRATAPDGAVSFKVTVDLRPKFELPSLEGIPVDDEDTAVTDAGVQERVDSIRRSLAEYADMPEGESTLPDDSLTISFEGRAEDGRPLDEAYPGCEAFARKDSAYAVAGSDYFMVPGVPKALVGVKPGDKVEVPVEFPKDFFKDELKGVKAVYSVEVKSARRMKLPELDAEFFKKLSVNDEADLRARIREGMERDAKQADRVRRVNQIARFLANSVSFEVPQGALERQTEAILVDLLRFNMDKGVAKEDLSKERERLQDTARAQAEERLRTDFVLDAARDKLGVALTDDEFNGYVTEIARRERLTAPQIRELAKDRARLRHYHAVATREKVLAELLKTAKPTAGVK